MLQLRTIPVKRLQPGVEINPSIPSFRHPNVKIYCFTYATRIAGEVVFFCCCSLFATIRNGFVTFFFAKSMLKCRFRLFATIRNVFVTFSGFGGHLFGTVLVKSWPWGATLSKHRC